jgi:hypothetical protein
VVDGEGFVALAFAPGCPQDRKATINSGTEILLQLLHTLLTS